MSAGIPLVAVSMGDPGGIGPEVIVKALADSALRDSARWVISGLHAPLREAAQTAGQSIFWSPVVSCAPEQAKGVPREAGDVVLVDHSEREDPGRTWRGRSDAERGRASLSFVHEAMDLALSDATNPWHADAVVTGPISKVSWAAAGELRFPGHTELFAHRCGVQKYAMMFHAPAAEGPVGVTGAGLNVILTTVHQPLRTVAAALTAERIEDVIVLGHDAMRRLGVVAPRIGVCGVNPHAGEGGLLGDEDSRVIASGVALARARGIDAAGPLPADTIFQRALWFEHRAPERFDLVVAMYHDQGLIPLKTIAWDRAVNWTVGLPIIRTSPDHGTAFDLVGKNAANPGSMQAAMGLAVRLATSPARVVAPYPPLVRHEPVA